jgi:hypothetical protein
MCEQAGITDVTRVNIDLDSLTTPGTLAVGGGVTTLVSVHGTGVRRLAYGAAFDRFAERIACMRQGRP